MKSLLASALLLIAVFAAAPAQAAPPGPVCVMAPCGPQPPADYLPTDCELQQATPSTLPYTTLDPREQAWGEDTADCDVDVEPTYTCVGDWGQSTERDLAFVHVEVLVCDGGLGDRIGDLVQLA